MPLRCGSCGDAIGAYEPLLYVDDDGLPVRTSLLRLPAHVRSAPGARAFFHASCDPDPA